MKPRMATTRKQQSLLNEEAFIRPHAGRAANNAPSLREPERLRLADRTGTPKVVKKQWEKISALFEQEYAHGTLRSGSTKPPAVQKTRGR
jgi:hypothetical protein